MINFLWNCSLAAEITFILIDYIARAKNVPNEKLSGIESMKEKNNCLLNFYEINKDVMFYSFSYEKKKIKHEMIAVWPW